MFNTHKRIILPVQNDNDPQCYFSTKLIPVCHTHIIKTLLRRCLLSAKSCTKRHYLIKHWLLGITLTCTRWYKINPCWNFNSPFVKQQLTSMSWWLITSYGLMWVWLLKIQCQFSKSLSVKSLLYSWNISICVILSSFQAFKLVSERL